MSLVAAAVLTATEVVADVSAKQGNLAGALAGYNLLALELKSFLYDNGAKLSLTNAYWNAMTNVTHAILGVTVFGETLSTTQMVGIGFVTAGILLLGYE